MVESYVEAREEKATSGRGLTTLVKHLDLGNALVTLPPWEWEVVLLHGLLRLDAVDVRLGISRTLMYERYRAAVERMTGFLNGTEADRHS